MGTSYAYVGCRTTIERNARGKGISIYEVNDQSGHWKYIDTISSLPNPSYLLVNEETKNLYTIHGDNEQVSAYGINDTDGRLVFKNTVSCMGKNPVFLSFSKEKNEIKIANYATGTIATLPVLADGSLADVVDLITLPGEPGFHRVEQTSSHPHFIKRFSNIESDSDWYIVPDKGTDSLNTIRWDVNNKAEIISVHAREGSAPRHAVFHPYKPLIYTANELDSTLTTWAFDPVFGVLKPIKTISVIPTESHGLTRAAGIAITNDGSTIYVSNRGHDSIAVIKINDAGLPVVTTWVDTKGAFPRFICLSKDDQFLYVANEKSDSIVQFDITSESRIPKASGHIINTGSPVCIVFANFL